MLFRNRRLVRVAASFLLLETLTTIIAPSVSFSSIGPGQVEFTSYESPGSTDMVNLTTGDLTYNLPVLDVPGPEFGFSLPLTYRAGIRLEQEASWVGLGWSLNPGALARGLNGYPDDVSNVNYRTTFHKNVDRGWTGGIPGLIDLGWSSETGHSGSVDLIGLASASWAGGKFKSADLVGVKYTKGEGISVDPVRMAAAAATIASAGTSATLSVGASMALQAGTTAGAGIAANILGKASGSGGFNRPTVRTEKGFLGFYTNYWVFYDEDANEKMYGSLYFRDMSKDTTTAADHGDAYKGIDSYNRTLSGKRTRPNTFNYYRWEGRPNEEVAADLHQTVGKGDNSYYGTSMRPLSIAHDNFSVMGTGVSGNIRPQLLEMGSLAMPRRMSNLHYKYSIVPFLDDYKVGFRYENSASNGYNYHYNDNQTVGIDSDQGAMILKDERLITDSDRYRRTAPARKGIRNAAAGRTSRSRGFVQGKSVDWFTNQEILNQSGGADKVLESDHAGRPGDFRLTLPGKGIGAFAVTAEDGTTYHYSLPVYHYGTYTHTREVTSSGDPGISTTTMGKGNKVYATTWALTAITSPDYIDRGQPGIVDDADWGGWTKFTYGRFNQYYKWRQPYTGESYQAKDMGSASYSEGYKETYYLNSIRTRTHTALFVKSVRNDARGYANQANDELDSDGTYPIPAAAHIKSASSLRLDEIVLLNNEDYLKLQTADGIRAVGDAGGTIPPLTTNTSNNASTWNSAELGSMDTYANVFDGHDLTTDGRIRSFVDARALKRIKFNYSYNLCQGVPSSFVSVNQPQATSGKLTLESLSMYGPQSTKLMPDFQFAYGYNPAYGRDKWDGYGMYKRDAVESTTTGTHGVSTNYEVASQDGAAWSLTSITSPLGGKTQFSYERDQYAHVSEYGTTKIEFSNTDCSTTLQVRSFAGLPTGNLQDYFRAGDKIKLKGAAVFTGSCYEWVEYQDGTGNWTYVDSNCLDYYEDREVTIASVSWNSIQLSAADAPVSCSDVPVGDCSAFYPTGMSASTLIPAIRNGGDIRVAAVTTSDENNQSYQVRYRYNQAAGLPTWINSSGVISKESPYADAPQPHDFEGWFDYPTTPVMYGLVTVLRGRFTNNQDTDHDQREEYSFFTPASSMIIRNADFNKNGSNYSSVHLDNRGDNGNRRLFERMDNRSVIDVGKIGQPINVRKYNKRGEMEFTTTFNYTNEAAARAELPNPEGITGQGRYTEGVMTNEMLDNFVFRVNRSTKEYIPTVMTGSTTIANGMRVDNYNDLYDFFTGQSVESHAKNSLGQEFVTKTVPAYTLPAYAAMGPKTENSSNRNMLTQTAATYVYKRTGTQPLALASGQVQTWKSDWTYRSYNSGTDRYENATLPKAVWRLHRSYVWNGARLNADGTYAAFTDFNWSNPAPNGQNSGWTNTAEVTAHNQYSRPIETRDVNGAYGASKGANNSSVTTVSVGNARYNEIAYSGAEDQLFPIDGNTSVIHFGGEVRDGNRRSSTYAHAGIYSSRLTAGQAGFTYKATVGNSNDVSVNRKYRLSAWVRADGYAPAVLANGKLYASLNGTQIAVTSTAAATTKKAGDWYLLNLYFDLPQSATGQQLVVGCRNDDGSGTLYFDDFRFQPLLTTMTANNFDQLTGQVTYVLDNDNLFTHYQYDNTGKMLRIFKEQLDRPGGPVASGQPGNPAPGERLVKEYAYNYARNATYTVRASAAGTGQVTSSVAGGLVNAVNYGGTVRYQAQSTDCNWIFTLNQPDAIQVDGVNITTDRPLADGTYVSRNNDGCTLSNVRGAHTVVLTFGNYPNYPVDSHVYEQCEVCESTGCYTGYVIYQVADGCGGFKYGGAWQREYNRYACPQGGCSNRTASKAKKSAAKGGTADAAFVEQCMMVRPAVITQGSPIKQVKPIGKVQAQLK
jgi:hypothetical protein